MPRSRKVTRKKTAAKRSIAPALDIKSSFDVKKALDIMKKHPLTIVLVFANWCPHCHTFMSRWNKLKGIPNRTSPMISVEQQFSNELLSNMSDGTGKPPQIDGYPTVLANSNRGSQNVGVQVSTVSDEALTNLAQGNATMNASENSNNSMNIENENENENSNNNNMNTNENNNNMTNINENNNINGSIEASYFSESADKKEKGSVRSTVPSAVHVKKLSAAVRKAVANASDKSMKEAKRLRGKADEELSFAPSGFASPPPRENSTMTGGAGAPSGLCRLSGGNQQPTLYSMLKELNMASFETAAVTSPKRTHRKRTKNRK